MAVLHIALVDARNLVECHSPHREEVDRPLLPSVQLKAVRQEEIPPCLQELASYSSQGEPTFRVWSWRKHVSALAARQEGLPLTGGRSAPFCLGLHLIG